MLKHPLLNREVIYTNPIRDYNGNVLAEWCSVEILGIILKEKYTFFWGMFLDGPKWGETGIFDSKDFMAF